MSRPSPIHAGLLALLCPLAGCQSINEQIGLTGTEPLPALSETDVAPPPADQPSITDFDRRSWQTVTVEVPIRQVENRPTYVANLHWPKQPEAWRDAFPGGASALHDKPDATTDIIHGGLAPAFAAGLLVWAPIDMAVLQNWPWRVTRSPQEPYQRVPTRQPVNLWPWIDFQPAPVEQAAEQPDRPEAAAETDQAGEQPNPPEGTDPAGSQSPEG